MQRNQTLDVHKISYVYYTGNLVRNTWLWPVYGEIMFPLPDYGPNSAHWNIQKLRNPSVTNDISKVVKVLKVLPVIRLNSCN